jgi:hypothetical protein
MNRFPEENRLTVISLLLLDADVRTVFRVATPDAATDGERA